MRFLHLPARKLFLAQGARLLTILLIALLSACSLDGNQDRTLESIQVKTPPQGPFLLGEDLNLTGMVVTGFYSDKSQEELNPRGDQIQGYDKNTLGEQTLTVTIQRKSADFSITLEQVKLRVLNIARGDAEEEAAIWEQFAQDNPGIALEKTDVSPGAYEGAIQEYLAANTLPDVLYAWTGGPSRALHREGWLKDLSPFLQEDELFSSFHKVLYSESQLGGKLGVIPLGFEVKNIFYSNITVLRDCLFRPAVNYPGLLDQAEEIIAGGYKPLVISGGLSNAEGALFSLFAGRLNGLDWGRRLFTGDVKFTDSAFIEVLTGIQNLYAQGVISQDSFQATESAEAALLNGEYAYYMGGLGKAIRDEAAVETGVFPPLAADSESGVSVTAALSPGWGMNSNLYGIREKAAWRLISWLTGKEVQTWLYDQGYIQHPSRIDAAEDSADISFTLEILGELNFLLPEPPLDQSVWAAIAEVVRELTPGGLSPEAGAARIQGALDASL